MITIRSGGLWAMIRLGGTWVIRVQLSGQ